MPITAQEVYRTNILPMSEEERLKLAALIINDLQVHQKSNFGVKKAGGIRELFGSENLGYPTGTDNDSIDADLASEYANDHED
ncbi:MAG TPA: hypothetical protein VK612_12870 [Pyrinomonadaceae bacterium]|nr:hypothetical protein [Pyrinomonadaceae bacterium]